MVSEIILQENEKLADEKAAFEKKISERTINHPVD